MNKQIIGVKFQELTIANRGGDIRKVLKFSDKEYHYFSLSDVKVDDLVIVETINGLRIGKVSQILSESNYASAHVIQKIDLQSYQDRVERFEKAETIKAQLNTELKKQQEIKLYESIATDSDDESIKALAEEYLEMIKQ